MQRIVFVSRTEAETTKADPAWVVISISGPEKTPARLEEGWANVLRLQFLDEDDVRGRKALFDRRMARSVLALAHQAVNAGQSILVHCHAGVSRSAAVAIALGQAHQLPVFSGHVPLSPSYSLHNQYVYRVLHHAIRGSR